MPARLGPNGYTQFDQGGRDEGGQALPTTSIHRLQHRGAGLRAWTRRHTRPAHPRPGARGPRPARPGRVPFAGVRLAGGAGRLLQGQFRCSAAPGVPLSLDQIWPPRPNSSSVPGDPAVIRAAQRNIHQCKNGINKALRSAQGQPEYAFNDQHSRDGKVRIALRSAS